MASVLQARTGTFGKPFVAIRLTIQATKGASVPTSLFLDKTHCGIRAIIGCSLDRSDESDLPVVVVHNHVASNPVPSRILGSSGEEWIAVPDGPDALPPQLN